MENRFSPYLLFFKNAVWALTSGGFRIVSDTLVEIVLHWKSKKLDHISFEHNFGKYFMILIILSLLQTEINYDKVYHNIYHHTWNFITKDATVEQVSLNVTDMDKINIVTSQAVLQMSSFSMDTRSMSSSPLVNSLVKNWLFKTAPDIDEPPFQFIHTMDLSVVDTMLHDSPDLVIHRIEICAVWRPQVGCKKVWHERIRDVMIMRYTNLLFTYLLT